MRTTLINSAKSQKQISFLLGLQGHDLGSSGIGFRLAPGLGFRVSGAVFSASGLDSCAQSSGFMPFDKNGTA